MCNPSESFCIKSMLKNFSKCFAGLCFTIMPNVGAHTVRSREKMSYPQDENGKFTPFADAGKPMLAASVDEDAWFDPVSETLASIAVFAWPHGGHDGGLYEFAPSNAYVEIAVNFFDRWGTAPLADLLDRYFDGNTAGPQSELVALLKLRDKIDQLIPRLQELSGEERAAGDPSIPRTGQ